MEMKMAETYTTLTVAYLENLYEIQHKKRIDMVMEKILDDCFIFTLNTATKSNPHPY